MKKNINIYFYINKEYDSSLSLNGLATIFCYIVKKQKLVRLCELQILLDDDGNPIMSPHETIQYWVDDDLYYNNHNIDLTEI